MGCHFLFQTIFLIWLAEYELLLAFAVSLSIHFLLILLRRFLASAFLLAQ